jgi:hypothetical protein
MKENLSILPLTTARSHQWGTEDNISQAIHPYVRFLCLWRSRFLLEADQVICNLELDHNHFLTHPHVFSSTRPLWGCDSLQHPSRMYRRVVSVSQINYV